MTSPLLRPLAGRPQPPSLLLQLLIDTREDLRAAGQPLERFTLGVTWPAPHEGGVDQAPRMLASVTVETRPQYHSYSVDFAVAPDSSRPPTLDEFASLADVEAVIRGPVGAELQSADRSTWGDVVVVGGLVAAGGLVFTDYINTRRQQAAQAPVGPARP